MGSARISTSQRNQEVSFIQSVMPLNSLHCLLLGIYAAEVWQILLLLRRTVHSYPSCTNDLASEASPRP